MEKVRISKILSEQGLCSRREADKFIELGLVLLDGKTVSELGTKACRTQKVELKDRAQIAQSAKATIILNKPVGFISHLDDDKEFTPNTHFLDHLDGDEIDIVDVVVQISKKLDINIPEEDTFDIGTVGELINVVGKHVNV